MADIKKDRSRVYLTKEQLILISMLLSREIVEYRNTPYSGVQLYVQSCGDIRRKVKNELKRSQDSQSQEL